MQLLRHPKPPYNDSRGWDGQQISVGTSTSALITHTHTHAHTLYCIHLGTHKHFLIGTSEYCAGLPWWRWRTSRRSRIAEQGWLEPSRASYFLTLTHHWVNSPLTHHWSYSHCTGTPQRNKSGRKGALDARRAPGTVWRWNGRGRNYFKTTFLPHAPYLLLYVLCCPLFFSSVTSTCLSIPFCTSLTWPKPYSAPENREKWGW